MLSRATTRTSRLAAASNVRSIWGAAPQTADPLTVAKDVDCPVPTFDGPTDTKVRTLTLGEKTHAVPDKAYAREAARGGG